VVWRRIFTCPQRQEFRELKARNSGSKEDAAGV